MPWVEIYRVISVCTHLSVCCFGSSLQTLFDDIEAIPTVLGRVGRYSGHWLLHYQAYLTNNGLDPYTDFGKSYVDFLESSTCNSMPCDVSAMDVIGVIESGELKSVTQSRFFFEEVSDSEEMRQFFSLY